MQEESKEAKLLALTDLENLLSLSDSSIKFMTTKQKMNPLSPQKVHDQVINRLVEMLENIFEVVGSENDFVKMVENAIQ